jgi:hypothetical protein
MTSLTTFSTTSLTTFSTTLRRLFFPLPLLPFLLTTGLVFTEMLFGRNLSNTNYLR